MDRVSSDQAKFVFNQERTLPNQTFARSVTEKDIPLRKARLSILHIHVALHLAISAPADLVLWYFEGQRGPKTFPIRFPILVPQRIHKNRV